MTIYVMHCGIIYRFVSYNSR